MVSSIAKQLTRKQEDFCLFFFTLKNATKAAIRAGYSPDTAQEMSAENLSKPLIQQRLAELQSHVPPSEAEIKRRYDKRVKSLDAIVEHDIEVPVSAGHVVAAARELNQMEHVYDSSRQNVNVIFVIGRGYRELREGGQNDSQAKL